MPAWWGKKSSKNKEESPKNQSPRATSTGFIKFSPNKADASAAVAVTGGGCVGVKNKAAPPADDKNNANNNYPKSFDDVGGFVLSTRNSPRASKDFGVGGGGSTGFSGFDSDSVEKRGIPLPRPSVSSIQSDLVVGLGSGSPSVSSVSSSGSSEDNQITNDPYRFLFLISEF